MPEFYQDGPVLGNQYTTDAVLRSYLRRTLPAPLLAALEPEFERLGERVATDVLALGEAAEADPPRHVPFDAWGRRIDRIETSDAWRALGRFAAEEGLVAIPYERAHGALSRIDQFVRLYLFGPSSATYSCPLAMSDGAARVLESCTGDAPLRAAFAHLVSRDPSQAWTSGQWMTERSGGSDVGGTSTVAKRAADGGFRLYGTKWFTSATTAQMAMTLARIEGAAGGSHGLSLFCVELRDEAGALRGVRVHRLKDKLGTRALPTAELTMDGAPARLVGEEGVGVRRIATLFNITRVHNACAAVAGMRRAIALARSYADRRVAFGRPLSQHALHADTLFALEVQYAAAFHLTFHVIELLGRAECNVATEGELAALRLLTPVAKLYTAKQAVSVASEALECFGGAGYIEDTGLPRLLRDAQVLPIWEGTTNVLSLDVLRAIEREHAFAPFLADLDDRLARVREPAMAGLAALVRERAHRLAEVVERAGGGSSEGLRAQARDFAYAVARVTSGALLVEHAAWCASHEEGPRWAMIAERWCARELERESMPGGVA